MRNKKTTLTNKETQDLTANYYKISRNGYTVIKLGDRFIYIKD